MHVKKTLRVFLRFGLYSLATERRCCPPTWHGFILLVKLYSLIFYHFFVFFIYIHQYIFINNIRSILLKKKKLQHDLNSQKWRKRHSQYHLPLVLPCPPSASNICVVSYQMYIIMLIYSSLCACLFVWARVCL
jgi:hypothetical protein